MFLISGLGLLAAAIPLPRERGSPVVPTCSRMTSTDPRAAPNPGNWTVQNWQDDTWPPVASQYRDDRQNVFPDGNSNLVIRATRKTTRLQRQGARELAGADGPHLGGARQADCLVPGAGPRSGPSTKTRCPTARWTSWSSTAASTGPGTTVHAASNGKTWEGKSIAGLVDGAWHNWRMRWDENGFKFWRDYVDGAKPYFTVPPRAHPGARQPGPALAVQQSGSWLACSTSRWGPGGGDPALTNFPGVDARRLDRIS